MEDSDILRCVNKGDKPLTIMYDSKSYLLKPEEDSFVPFVAVACSFGDPRSAGNLNSIRDQKGIVTYVPDRETEVRRLRIKYDNQMGDETVITRHPIVEVYTLDGQRVYTVLDDPQGDQVNVATQTVAEQDTLMNIVERQQGQIEALMKIVAAQQEAAQTTAEEKAEIPIPVPVVPVPETPIPTPDNTQGTAGTHTEADSTTLSDIDVEAKANTDAGGVDPTLSTPDGMPPPDTSPFG